MTPRKDRRIMRTYCTRNGSCVGRAPANVAMELAIYPSMPRLDWLVKLYENFTYVRMWPAAIALNYSVKDIRNDVRQIIIAIEQTSVGLAHARPLPEALWCTRPSEHRQACHAWSLLEPSCRWESPRINHKQQNLCRLLRFACL